MPYYIGDVIKESKKLVIRTPEEFKKTGIDVKIKTQVKGVDAQKGTLSLSDGTTLPYDTLVMATGADALRLDIPGADLEGVHVISDRHAEAEILPERAELQEGRPDRGGLYRDGDVRGIEEPGD